MKKSVGAVLRFFILLQASFAIFVSSSFALESSVDKTLLPTREMRAETIYMVRCMEELHLEHKNISLLDNKAILLEYLQELDQSKMIFLQKDVDELVKKFVPTLDIFVSGGSLMPAFNIFERFRTIAYDRMEWIFSRLDQPFDFSEKATFMPNRKDCSWPQAVEDADELWEKRLKFEILNESFALCKAKTSSDNKNDDPNNELDEQYNENNEKVKEQAAKLYSKEDVESHLDEAIKNVRKRYESWKRSYKDFDSWLVQEMFLNSISKMYDPHTSFLSKDSFEDLNIHIRNSLVGIGAELRDENGFCTINNLTPGGPAKISGEIKAGDKIIAVAQGDDGEFADIVGLRLYKTVKLLRGKKDTVVRVKIESVSGDTKIVRLVRDNIKLNATRASAKYFELRHGDEVLKLGVVELPSFYGDTTQEKDQCIYADKDIEDLLEILKSKEIDGLIIDLRQNGGGLLNQAVSIAGLFITTGPVVQVKDSFGKIEKYCDEGSRIQWDGPLAVLSSSMSASASEILIGALRDHKRAVIVGAEATYGKGSVQAALDMNVFFNSLNGNKDLGAAYITVQKWYLPTGISTQLKGVPADIKLRSLDECLHRREADYPHALAWDTVPPADFDYDSEARKIKCFVTEDLIERLNKFSVERQGSLEEFKVSEGRIEYFNNVVNKKEYALNIDDRLADKILDDEFKNKIKSEVEILEKAQAFTCESIKLPDISEEEANCQEDKEDIDGIVIFDTNMHECLRIVADWVKILQTN